MTDKAYLLCNIWGKYTTQYTAPESTVLEEVCADIFRVFKEVSPGV